MIRLASLDDVPAINLIYNQAIRSLGKTADLKPIALPDHEKWFEDRDSDMYPLYVLDIEDQTVGYFYFAPYRKGREALNQTAEITYYLDEDHLGKGLGTKLMEYGLSQAADLGFTTLVAILLDCNKASIGILRKFGFEEWGRVPKAARIKGIEYDHLYYGRKV